MKADRYITLGLAVALLAPTGSAQSRAYAKFDTGGETIGLFNLSEAKATCAGSKALSGTIRKVRSRTRGTEISFSFTLDTGVRRSASVSFTVNRDAIPIADIENMLMSKRCFLVTVRACRDGGRWVAVTITRT